MPTATIFHEPSDGEKRKRMPTNRFGFTDNSKEIDLISIDDSNSAPSSVYDGHSSDDDSLLGTGSPLFSKEKPLETPKKRKKRKVSLSPVMAQAKSTEVTNLNIKSNEVDQETLNDNVLCDKRKQHHIKPKHQQIFSLELTKATKERTAKPSVEVVGTESRKVKKTSSSKVTPKEKNNNLLQAPFDDDYKIPRKSDCLPSNTNIMKLAELAQIQHYSKTHFNLAKKLLESRQAIPTTATTIQQAPRHSIPVTSLPSSHPQPNDSNNNLGLLSIVASLSSSNIPPGQNMSKKMKKDDTRAAAPSVLENLPHAPEYCTAQSNISADKFCSATDNEKEAAATTSSLSRKHQCGSNMPTKGMKTPDKKDCPDMHGKSRKDSAKRKVENQDTKTSLPLQKSQRKDLVTKFNTIDRHPKDLEHSTSEDSLPNQKDLVAVDQGTQRMYKVKIINAQADHATKQQSLPDQTGGNDSKGLPPLRNKSLEISTEQTSDLNIDKAKEPRRRTRQQQRQDQDSSSKIESKKTKTAAQSEKCEEKANKDEVILNKNGPSSLAMDSEIASAKKSGKKQPKSNKKSKGKKPKGRNAGKSDQTGLNSNDLSGTATAKKDPPNVSAKVEASSNKNTDVPREKLTKHKKTATHEKTKKKEPVISEHKNDAPITQSDSCTKAKASTKNNINDAVAETPKAQKRASSKTATSAKKRKKRNFQDQVLYHMIISMKPFTLKSLAQAVQCSETQIEYTMLSLIDKAVVMKKDFTSSKGRTKTLYWANLDSKSKHSLFSNVSTDEVQATQKEFATLKHKEAQMLKELSIATSEPSNEDLAAKVSKEEEQLKALKNRLDGVRTRIEEYKQPRQLEKQNLIRRKPMQVKHSLSSNRMIARNGFGGGGVKASAHNSSPRNLKISINKMRMEWKNRKEKCMDFVDQLADGLEKKLKDVVKILDLETDEQLGVKLPPKHTITK